MTVDQLIQRLQAFPGPLPVMIRTADKHAHAVTSVWPWWAVADPANPPGTAPIVVLLDVDKSQ